MHENSLANRAPASRPAGKVPSRSNNFTPRTVHQIQSKTVAPSKRSDACQSGGTSPTVVLIRFCWNPQNRQEASRSEIASESRWVLRSSKRRSKQTPRDLSQQLLERGF